MNTWSEESITEITISDGRVYRVKKSDNPFHVTWTIEGTNHEFETRKGVIEHITTRLLNP